MLDLSRLSDEQRQVVLAPSGPLAIIAGPGSGKTTVLAARIAYLVTLGQVTPSSVLALTFTAVAVRTLRDRLAGVLGDQAAAIDVQTFHALGLRIVRQWSAQLGFGPRPPVVCSDDDTRSLLREAMRTTGFDPGRASPADLRRRLERFRLAPEAGAAPEQLALLVETYEQLLRRRGAVDYPAMLALPRRLFATHPRALRVLQDAYRAIFCDEAQDVCACQYEQLRLLADQHRHLVLVGDPRQTLYGWRGADHRFLRDFARDFPGALLLRLDRNFRSSGRIVAIANSLGRRLGEERPLWTTNPPGPPPLLYVADDEQDEARYVVHEIARLLTDGIVDRPGDVAVLYRTNRQAGELALALRVRGLPYRGPGPSDDFDRREVRDAVAYLRLVHDPTDVASLVRIANVPPRRLGWLKAMATATPPTLDGLVGLARQRGRDAVANAEALVALVGDLHQRRVTLRPATLLDEVLERSGYHAWLAGQPDGPERLTSIALLRGFLEQVAPDPSADTSASWLDHLPVRDDEEESSRDADAIRLTTIHQAKGDEARVVFVVGVEEGLLPHARALGDSDEPAGLVAECQVAYVAVTRARERLYLTCCRTRRRGDGVDARRPSRFLQGLPLA